MKNKYKILLVVGVIALLVCITSFTFAYLRKTDVQSGTNIISAVSCLNVSIINETDAINLNDAYPITDEIALKSAMPYKFSIKNTCANFIEADINLESLAVSNQLDKKYIKVYINSKDMNEPKISILDSLEDRTPIIENATSDSLFKVNIEPYAKKEFELKLWIDYNTTSEQGMNKYYEGKITVNITPYPENILVYGVRRNIDSVASTWERLGGAVNLVANAQIGTTTPVRNDFDNIYPWSDIITYNYEYDSSTGTVTETMYGDDEFDFSGANGEVLTRIPEFYYNRYQQTESDGKTYEYVFISAQPIDGFYKSETFSVGRYTLRGSFNTVHSASGSIPLTNVSISDFRSYIRNTSTLGDDFGQLDYHYFILQLLYLVEYANYNSQEILGQGNVNNTAVVKSGGCDNLGMKSGTLNNDGKHSMIYRGIEDIYGNIFQFVDGINIKDYVTYICKVQTQYAVDTFTGCYKPVGYTNLSETGVYSSKLGYDADNPLVAMPIASGGSSSTYITDYYYSNPGNRIARVGGDRVDGPKAGLWYWIGDVPSSYTYTYTGARLLRTN